MLTINDIQFKRVNETVTTVTEASYEDKYKVWEGKHSWRIFRTGSFTKENTWNLEGGKWSVEIDNEHAGEFDNLLQVKAYILLFENR